MKIQTVKTIESNLTEAIRSIFSIVNSGGNVEEIRSTLSASARELDVFDPQQKELFEIINSVHDELLDFEKNTRAFCLRTFDAMNRVSRIGKSIQSDKPEK